MPAAPTELTDPTDPRLDDYRDLRGTGRGERTTARTVVVAEGLLAAERLLTSRHRPRSVVATPARLASVLDRLGPTLGTTPVLVADRAVLAEVCGFDVHRGVLAAADRAGPTPVEDLLGHPRLVVCEGLGDHENLGAVFRTAAALGLDGVLLDDRTADPLYRRCVRVSMGWSLHLPWARSGPLPHTFDVLAASGHRTVALTPGPDAIDVDAAAAAGLLDGPVALVLGAEGPGLATATLEAADVRVRVPMASEVDSLNVATALGIVGAFTAARAGWPAADGDRQP